MNWQKVSEVGAPPFDQLVLVRGKNEYDNYEYAIAYNECCRPDMAMTQVIKVPKGINMPVYAGVPFRIEEWIILD